MALLSFRSHSLLPKNLLLEQEQLGSLKNEELKCEKVTQEVKESSRTKTQNGKSKDWEQLIGRTNCSQTTGVWLPFLKLA